MVERTENFASAFLFSDRVAQLEYAASHPFKPIRAKLTLDLCRRYGLIDRPWVRVLEPRPLDFAAMAEFHDTAYLKTLQEANTGSLSPGLWMDQLRSAANPLELDPRILQYGLGTGDNPIFPGVYDFAALTAGGTLMAAQMLAEGEVQVAFNPMGGFHHAGRDHAEGFCFVNDIVIAILHLLRRGLRVAYVDIDAHHGNGVQDAFYADNRVLYISFHETGKDLYPWSGFENEIGEGAGRGFNVNIPMPKQTDDDAFLRAFEEIVPPLLYAFGPDIVVAELGADTHRADPLTDLNMTNYGFSEAVRMIMEDAPRLLALGGGGYDIYKTARSWALAWGIMNGLEPVDEYAGIIGGMMFGPESEAGSLHDRTVYTKGMAREGIQREMARVVEYIKWNIFPIHRIYN